MPNLSYVCYKHIVPRGMAVKPGSSGVHHIVILWMSNGRKQFAGLLVCPGRRGTSCFLVWQVLRIFFRNKNVGLPDYLMLCLQATTLRFAFLPPGRLFLPLEYLVVTGYTLQTSTPLWKSNRNFFRHKFFYHLFFVVCSSFYTRYMCGDQYQFCKFLLDFDHWLYLSDILKKVTGSKADVALVWFMQGAKMELEHGGKYRYRCIVRV